jgi:hypothetical protein
MKSMRRYLIVFVMLSSLGTTGCASWIKQWKDNPVLALQTNLTYVQSALQAAMMAFNTWGAANPDSVAGFRDQFNEIVGRAQQGVTVAMDGARIAAVAGRSSPPDVDALLVESRNALGDIAVLFQRLPTQPGRAPDPSMARAMASIEAARRPMFR